MTDDFEDSVRKALADAVPPPPEEPDRAAGARGYSRRVRRTRAALAVGAAAAVVAAIVAIPTVLASSDDTAGPGPRAPDGSSSVGPPTREPASVCLPRLGQPPPEHGVVQPGAVLARICPGSAYWSPPSGPLVTDVDGLAQQFNALRLVPRGAVYHCPVQTMAEPAYTLTFQYSDGHTASVQGSLSGCQFVSAGRVARMNASELLRDYLERLHEQRQADATSGPPATTALPSCGQDPPATVPVLVDGRAGDLVSAEVCSYVFPGATNPTAAGVLSSTQVGELNADIAANAHPKPRTGPVMRECRTYRGPSGASVIVALNSSGDLVRMIANGCMSEYQFFDRGGIWFWTPSKSTQVMLDAVQRTVPHPNGRVEGRLLAVGGPAGVAPRPLAGRVDFRGARGTSVIGVGSDGGFSRPLQPGRYRVVGHSPDYNDGKAACTPVRPYVTVRAHQTTHVDVLCQED